MLRAIKEAKERLFAPALLDISLTSLENVFNDGQYTGFMVSFGCKLGGGQIIPIDSNNLSVHLANLREHLDHEDEIKLSIWSQNKPIMLNTRLVALTPQKTAEFRLIP